jgi:hypothetical protein
MDNIWISAICGLKDPLLSFGFIYRLLCFKVLQAVGGAREDGAEGIIVDTQGILLRGPLQEPGNVVASDGGEKKEGGSKPGTLVENRLTAFEMERISASLSELAYRRNALRELDWRCLGNSWEQREVI